MKSIDPQMSPFFDRDADSGERTWAAFNHFVGLLSLVDATILGLIGTIVMWRVKAKQSPFLDDHGRDAVNFQLSLFVYFIGGSILSVGILAVPLFVAVAALRCIGCLRGAMAANRGEYYRYPMCIRFISEPRIA